MLFAGALLFWAVTLTTLTLVELSGFVAPDEKEKLRLVGGSFALSFFYSAVREAFTTREKPIMFRLTALLFVANLTCLLSDTLALDELSAADEGAAAKASRFHFGRRTARHVAAPPRPWRFATKHVVATLLALVIHYSITGLKILLNFVSWRLASLPPPKVYEL